MTVFKAT